MYKTIFCDIDGTLVKHCLPTDSSSPNCKLELLPGTTDKMLEWSRKGYKVILTTGRRESQRAVTEKQLSEACISYDQLIMGIGRGERVIINDKKEDGKISCSAICVERNKGLKDIEI